jgi:hypothetical protein
MMSQCGWALKAGQPGGVPLRTATLPTRQAGFLIRAAKETVWADDTSVAQRGQLLLCDPGGSPLAILAVSEEGARLAARLRELGVLPEQD